MVKSLDLTRWILFSGFAIRIKVVFDLIIEYPLWLYRFSGVTDLPIMFGRLMIVSQIIHLKVEQDV